MNKLTLNEPAKSWVDGGDGGVVLAFPAPTKSTNVGVITCVDGAELVHWHRYFSLPPVHIPLAGLGCRMAA